MDTEQQAEQMSEEQWTAVQRWLWQLSQTITTEQESFTKEHPEIHLTWDFTLNASDGEKKMYGHTGSSEGVNP